MAGANQHHIPRFLQRGFAAAGSGGHKIWRFEKNRFPKKTSSIRSTGAEEHFYSEPSVDGTPTLDDAITAQENSLSDKLIELRSWPVGTEVDSALAAELVNHFSPRTAHLRQTLERGMRQLISGAAELISQQDKIERLLGLDKSTPTKAFSDRFSEELKRLGQIEQISQLGLPEELIERIAFQHARENFDVAMVEALPAFHQLFAVWLERAGDVARSGHNKALSKNGGPNARFDHLASLRWKLAAAPTEGAILPDCVAVAQTPDGMSPLMLADLDEAAAIAMPVSSQIILVGGPMGDEWSAANFNRDAARASHRFFLSATNAAEIAALQPLIDERASSLVDEAVEHAFKDFIPQSNLTVQEEEQERDAPEAAGEVISELRWEMSLQGMYESEEAAADLIEAVRSVVVSVGHSLPLSRLQGITLSADYRAALSDIDRGIPGVSAPSSIDPSIGTGIAQTVNIMRDGVAMCRIVLASDIGFGLLSDDAATVGWATGILVRQLMLVAFTEAVDVTLPGVMLQPIADPLSGWLYEAIGTALDGYVVSHMASGFGDPSEMANDWRQLLTEALDRMHDTILPARLAYRYDGDLDGLLATAMPCIRHVLMFAADLLGHCGSLGIRAVEPGSDLDTALDRTGLKNWLPRYAADLETFRQGYGKWQSFNEFLALNIHVERLMWQLGMIPWTDENGMRVEVPLETDAEALMADLLRLQQLPPIDH